MSHQNLVVICSVLLCLLWACGDESDRVDPSPDPNPGFNPDPQPTPQPTPTPDPMPTPTPDPQPTPTPDPMPDPMPNMDPGVMAPDACVEACERLIACGAEICPQPPIDQIVCEESCAEDIDAFDPQQFIDASCDENNDILCQVEEVVDACDCSGDMPGACSRLDPNSCQDDDVCIEDTCERAFGRDYEIAISEVILSELNDGECWDAGCGEPDPFIVLTVNDEALARSETFDNVFEAPGC